MFVETMKTVELSKKSLESLTPEKMEFIQKRFEEVLTQTITARESLHSKAGFLFALIGGFATFAFGKWMEMKPIPGLWNSLLVVEIAILAILNIVLVWKCMLPSDYASLGAEPENMLVEPYWSQEIVHMKLGYASLVQKRINSNRQANEKRAQTIRTVALVAAASPLAALLAALFFRWV